MSDFVDEEAMADNGKLEVIHTVLDRVQRLEDRDLDVAIHLAEQTATLKSIKEDICDLSSSIKEMINGFNAHVKEDSARLSLLENADKKEENKKEWRRKFLYTIIAAMGSAFALIVERLISR